MSTTTGKIFDQPELRDRVRVFRDRDHAGAVLADMLPAFRRADALLLAIPAGGVPVAAALARRLGLSLDVAVVSKITLPWNTESGYGAVAFDGTVRLNDALLEQLPLNRQEIDAGAALTRGKVERRVRLLRGDRPFPDLHQRSVILVDDGLASGFTLHTAVAALRNAAAREVIVAVPTAHTGSAERIAGEVQALYCPNLRGGWRYAVADAYEHWSDVDEATVTSILKEFAANSERQEP